MLNQLPELEPLSWNHIIVGISTIIVMIAASIKASLTKVKDQVTKNGGSSLLDAMARIETKVTELVSLNEATNQLSQKPMFKTDSKGNYTWVNTSYSLITGKAIEDLKGSGWLSIIPENDRERVKLEWDSAFSDGRRFESIYSIVNSSAGITYQVKCKAFPVITGKVVTGYIGVWFLLGTEVDKALD